jgi:pteridine reductase
VAAIHGRIHGRIDPAGRHAMQLNDRVVWVTGAGRRLGREVALDLARRGAHVAVHYRTSEGPAREVAAAIESLGRRAALVPGDLCNVAEIRRIVGQIDRAFGRLDVLVNCASTFERVEVERIDEAGWDRALDANLKGPFFCALEAARLMRRGGQGGKIVNFADWAAFRPYRHYLPYMIAKGGVVTMTRALALELAPEIQVNAVAPGPVLLPEGTTEQEKARIVRHVPLGRIGSPEDVTAAVAFLLEGSDYITGQVLCVDGGRLIAGV